MNKQTSYYRTQAKKFSEASNKNENNESESDIGKVDIVNQKVDTVNQKADIVNQVRYFWSDPDNQYQKCHVLLFVEEEQKYKVRRTDGNNFLIEKKFLCEEKQIREFL